MSRLLVAIALSLMIFPALTGCGGENPSRPEIAVETIDEGGFEKLVQERSGKILLVNVWATWCVPCVQEFPDLVRLANEYQGSNVEIVGISADFPDEIESKIVPFLKRQKAGFKNYVRNFSSDEAFINQVNPEWSGALPATIIYGSDGEQKTFLLGMSDYETFRDKIEALR